MIKTTGFSKMALVNASNPKFKRADYASCGEWVPVVYSGVRSILSERMNLDPKQERRYRIEFKRRQAGKVPDLHKMYGGYLTAE